MSYAGLFFQLLGAGGAREVYVSETGTGTGVGSESDPYTGLQFKSLVDAGLPGIPPNSTIFFKKGETFNYQYNIPDGNLTFSAYGTGNDPIISGSDNIGSQSWTLDSGSIYFTSLATEPKWVFVNGVEVPMAETDWIAITGRPIQTQISASSSTLSTLNGVESIVGSYILAKEWSFRPCLRRTVTAYNGTTTITMDAAPNTDAAGAGVGMPFKLLNKKSYITDVGEWSYDSSTQRLYVKTSGSSPAGTDIRVSTRDYGIKFDSGLSNLTVTGIKFQHQFLEGIYSVENHNVSVTNCTLSDIRTNGASFTGDGTSITFTNNTLTRISNNAVHIGAINGGTFSNNIFTDIGVQTGVSIPYYNYFKSVGSAICMRWDDTGTIWVAQNITAENNAIENCGYSGIVNTGIGNIVDHNSIDTYCVKWADGGGIYITNVYGVIYGNGSDTRDGTVSDNLVINGVAGARTLEGISGGTTAIMGIYFDNNVSAEVCDNNFIENIDKYGIFCNTGTGTITISNNIVIDSVKGIAFLKAASLGSNVNLHGSDGHIVEYNTIVNRINNRSNIYIEDVDNVGYNPFANGGHSNNNTFAVPYSSWICEIKNSTTTTYGLIGWQGVYGQDLNSVLLPYSLTNYGMLYVNSAKAAIDIVTSRNKTSSPTTFTPSSTYYYTDENSIQIVNVSVPAHSGKIGIRQYYPIISNLFDDTYTGGAGNLTGHTPDVGTAWTIESGTFALDGSGFLTASVGGQLTKTTVNKNAVLETTGQFSGDGGLNLVFRWISNTDRILVRLLYSSTGADSVEVLNDATLLFTYNPGTINASQNYKLKAALEDGTISVWLDDVLVIQQLNNATLAASNTSTKKHGIFVGTTVKHTRTTIWEI